MGYYKTTIKALNIEEITKKKIINRLINKKPSNLNKRQEKKIKRLNLDSTLMFNKVDAKYFAVLAVNKYYCCFYLYLSKFYF